MAVYLSLFHVDRQSFSIQHRLIKLFESLRHRLDQKGYSRVV